VTINPTKSVATISPAPPRAPSQYTQDWANQINRWLTNYTRLANFPAVLRGGRLYLPSLPASGYGLIVGEVYRDGDLLRIVLEGSGYVEGLSTTGSVGTLTVTV
jgi:hypothetical protein